MVAFSITCSGSSPRADLGAISNGIGSRSAAAMLAALALAACNTEAEHEQSEPLYAVELAAVDTITPLDAEKLSKAGKIRLIDVRTDEEVAEGIIPGAEHIDIDTFDPAKLDLSDGREPVLYCRSGRRSEVAAQKLSKFLGKKARHLKGGINAWRDAGLPVRRPVLF